MSNKEKQYEKALHRAKTTFKTIPKFLSANTLEERFNYIWEMLDKHLLPGFTISVKYEIRVIGEMVNDVCRIRFHPCGKQNEKWECLTDIEELDSVFASNPQKALIRYHHTLIAHMNKTKTIYSSMKQTIFQSNT